MGVHTSDSLYNTVCCCRSSTTCLGLLYFTLHGTPAARYRSDGLVGNNLLRCHLDHLPSTSHPSRVPTPSVSFDRPPCVSPIPPVCQPPRTVSRTPSVTRLFRVSTVPSVAHALCQPPRTFQQSRVQNDTAFLVHAVRQPSHRHITHRTPRSSHLHLSSPASYPVPRQHRYFSATELN